YYWLLIKAVSSDFSHFIDEAHPAMPGETIVTWMTGLGPLDGPLATGEPGPADPPLHPLAHLGCDLSITGYLTWRGVEVPFVAYAPGLAGFYQVDITIPSDWPAGVAVLRCYVGTAWSPIDFG